MCRLTTCSRQANSYSCPLYLEIFLTLFLLQSLLLERDIRSRIVPFVYDRPVYLYFYIVQICGMHPAILVAIVR